MPFLGVIKELLGFIVGAVVHLFSTWLLRVVYGVRFVKPSGKKEDSTDLPESIDVEGKYRIRPPGDLRLFIVETDPDRFWPQGQVVFEAGTKHWRSKDPIRITSRPGYPYTIVAAIVGENGRALCDFYYEANKEKIAIADRLNALRSEQGKDPDKEITGWMPIPSRLPPDITELDRIVVTRRE